MNFYNYIPQGQRHELDGGIPDHAVKISITSIRVSMVKSWVIAGCWELYERREIALGICFQG